MNNNLCKVIDLCKQALINLHVHLVNTAKKCPGLDNNYVVRYYTTDTDIVFNNM